MKKLFIFGFLSISVVIVFLILMSLPRTIDIVKFPEPSGVVIGIIEKDFDGNGHNRYLTIEEFETLDLEKFKIREVTIESAENGKSWIKELSQKKALLISAEEALDLVYRTFGYSYDYDDYLLAGEEFPPADI